MRSFKRIGVSALVFALLCVFLDLALYPCNMIRNDVHSLLVQDLDEVYLGTSHGKFNIDPAAILEETGAAAYTAANGNEYPVDSYYLVKLMVEKGKAPKRVVYVATPEYFDMEKEEGHNYLMFYHEFPLSLTKLQYFFSTVASTNIRTGLFPWYEYPLGEELKRLPQTLRQKLTGDYDISAFSGEEQQYHADGHVAHIWMDPKGFSFTQGEMFTEEHLVEENIEWIRKLIGLCKDNGIEFVAVTTPSSIPTMRRYEENFTEADRYFTAFFEEEGVPYYNFNGKYYDAFTHDIRAFTDLDGHLCQDAAWDFSKVMARVMASEGAAS